MGKLSWTGVFIITAIAFILIMFFDYGYNLIKINNIKNGKKKKKGDIKLIEVQYLSFKYKIVKERLYGVKFALLFAFLNAVIICGTFLVMELIPWHFVFRMLIGFVLLIGLIYSIYGILGSILVKRGYQNEYK